MPTAKNSSPTPCAQLTPAALDLIAARFRALGEGMRLRMIYLIMEKERSVGQLVEALESSQANVSKHLAVLRDAGMIGTRKDGLSTICFIADPIASRLCEMMCAHLRDEMERKAKALAFDPKI